MAGYRDGGAHSTELAGRRGLSHHSLLTILDRQAVFGRRQPMPESDPAIAIERYAAGLSIVEVGERLHRAPSTVFRTLRKADVMLRRRGRRLRQ